MIGENPSTEIGSLEDQLAKAAYELDKMSVRFAAAVQTIGSLVEELFSTEQFLDRLDRGDVKLEKFNLMMSNLDDDTTQVFYVGLTDEVVEAIMKKSREVH